MHVCTHRIVRTISTAAQCVGIILSCVPAMRVYLFRLAISVPAGKKERRIMCRSSLMRWIRLNNLFSIRTISWYDDGYTCAQ